MNSQTVNKTLRDLGFTGELVGHGFRGIASTYLHELDCFSYEAVEWCLSHETRNEVRKAYDKSQKWRSRQEIMQTWGIMLSSARFKPYGWVSIMGRIFRPLFFLTFIFI